MLSNILAEGFFGAFWAVPRPLVTVFSLLFSRTEEGRAVPVDAVSKYWITSENSR